MNFLELLMLGSHMRVKLIGHAIYPPTDAAHLLNKNLGQLVGVRCPQGVQFFNALCADPLPRLQILKLRFKLRMLLLIAPRDGIIRPGGGKRLITHG
jgi:hypothetical protein